MRSTILILALLTSSIGWTKPATTIDDTSDLTAKTWLVADADNRVMRRVTDLGRVVDRATRQRADGSVAPERLAVGRLRAETAPVSRAPHHPKRGHGEVHRTAAPAHRQRDGRSEGQFGEASCWNRQSLHLLKSFGSVTNGPGFP